ncbi:hypothetical protein [Microbacterium trichothecenolyticum]|uniref:Crossover junction endodeoxyribonuclease RuvC n=1 Tax=Microbacterium trichothecenolyticum TaxID=69370 RepID=A0A0M2HG14_MICTR|nr:hypothetical protein [Microbacterium trichothecenolyticum]KJL45591.1 Crossover junction endodeoxyribonuclease RuvC [Microbacterium trichothecenolyticum]
MTAFGIDLSLRSTGLVMFDGETWDKATIETTPKDSTPGSFLDRVDDIADQIINWCDPRQGDVLCLEGPALQAKSAQLDRMFALWWLVYKRLREHHAEPFVVQAQIIKQLATGKGNASKEAVLIQTVKRLGRFVDVENFDESDAAWLAVAAGIIAGLDPLPLPAAHLKGLNELIRKGAP